MITSKSPFRKAKDSWHKKFLQDPQACNQSRQLQMSDEAANLIHKMVALDHNARPDAKAVLADPWFQLPSSTDEELNEFAEQVRDWRALQQEVVEDRRKQQSTAATSGASRNVGTIALDENDHTLIETLVGDRWPDQSEESSNLFDHENNKQETTFGTFYLSNQQFRKPLMEELTLYLKKNNCSYKESDDDRVALSFKISDQTEFPEEEPITQDVEVELKLFKIGSEATEDETRVQVNINRVNGSTLTYRQFVNTLLKRPDAEGQNAGVLNKYNDTTIF